MVIMFKFADGLENQTAHLSASKVNLIMWLFFPQQPQFSQISAFEHPDLHADSANLMTLTLAL